MLNWAVLSAYVALAQQPQTVGVSVLSVKSMIAFLQDQEWMDFTTDASGTFELR